MLHWTCFVVQHKTVITTSADKTAKEIASVIEINVYVTINKSRHQKTQLAKNCMRHCIGVSV